jgi:hypothetical protein
MSKQRRHFLTISLLILALAFASLSSLSQAQDETPTETPPEEVFVEVSPPVVEIPTDIPPVAPPSPEVPSAEPHSATPVEQPTLEPSVEPTIELTATPTSEATPGVIETPSIEPTVAVTEAITAVPSEAPNLPPTDAPTAVPLPAEPPLTLMVEDTFDSGALDLWTLGAGWSLVPSESGQALQGVNSAEAVTFVHGDLFNVAVQARFFMSVGSAHLSVRQSSAGQYTASLGTDGLVELYRAGSLVQSAVVLPAAGQWHTLRLSAMDGVLRVSVDGVEVIAALDSAVLPPGAILIAGSADGALLVDDVSVLVPTSEIPPTEVMNETSEISTMAEALIVLPLVVTNSNDSGEGSLRAAIEYANTNPGADTITFNIAGTGPHSIRPLTALPFLLGSTSVDGLSQPGARCDAWPPTLMIELDGSTIAATGGVVNGLTISGSNSTIRGLVINRWPAYGILLGGDQNVITCNYIGTDVDGTAALGNEIGIEINTGSEYNTVGGTSPGAGNLISSNSNYGIVLWNFSNYNQILGNYIGTNATGSAALGNGRGIYTVDVSYLTIGGTTPGARNVISGNTSHGIYLTVDDPSEPPPPGNIVIAGNYIGTDASGTLALGNGRDGINDFFVPAVTIGGTTPEARNIISGNLDNGIRAGAGVRAIAGPPEPPTYVPTYIVGNYIGTDLTGTRPLGNGFGVFISDGITTQDNLISGNHGNGVHIATSSNGNDTVTHNIIGADVTGVNPLRNWGNGVYIYDDYGDTGTNHVTDNLIAFNGGAGVNVINATGYQSNTSSYEIRSNRIFDNTGLGIDLNGDGVTGNDYHDLDGRQYGLQNFPILLQAVSGTTVVTGRIETIPGSTYHIQVFSNTTCDLSGYGEGQTLVGETDIAVPASTYNVIFMVPVSALQVGQYLTATATSTWAGGGTSEFSSCFPVQVASGPRAPVLRYPLMNSTVSTARVSFSWNAVTGANRYHLQVASDPAFTTLLADVGVDITSAAPVVLPQGTYYWRVQARNAAGIWGSYSIVQSFSFALQRTPTHELRTTDTTPTFQWYAYPGARQYQLEVYENTNPYTPVIQQVVSWRSTSYTPVTPLPIGVYHWRVNVDTSLDSYPSYQISPILWLMSVIENPPPAPSLLLPVANAMLSDNTPEFSWNAFDGAVAYEIEIDGNTISGRYVRSALVSNPSYVPPSLPNGSYHWRVRIWLSTNTGPWSESRAFAVDAG